MKIILEKFLSKDYSVYLDTQTHSGISKLDELLLPGIGIESEKNVKRLGYIIIV